MHVVPLFRARVVVISSAQPFLHLIQTLLDGQGFSVSTSQGWETALALIGGLQPDLVIVDMAPGHEPACWTILEALVALPAAQAVPVLVCPVAGWLLEGGVASLAHPSVYIWREPFDPDDLLREVETALAARSSPERRARA